MVPVNIRTPPPLHGRTTHQIEGPGFFMIKCVRKIRILLLIVETVEEYPDFSISQSNYSYVAPMDELASDLKVWILPNFLSLPQDFCISVFACPWIFRDFCISTGFSLSYGGRGRLITLSPSNRYHPPTPRS